jgi:hypothetical protein
VALLLPVALSAQDRPEPPDRTSAWSAVQLVPGVSWTVHDSRSNFAFEWEAAPVLYSFGLTRLVSPWHFFVVEPPARFTGSIELVTTGRLFVRKLDRSYWGASAALLGHIPLVEYGEYLGLTVGVSRHWFGARKSDFVVGGVSILFSLVEYNIHYSPRDEVWIHEIAVRMF